jgi:hypothetical protein
MPDFPGKDVLGLDTHPDLHRCPSDEVQTPLEKEQVADVDGMMEIQTVYGRGHRIRAAMPRRRHTCRRVDKLHDDAAVYVARRVRVLRYHDLRYRNAAFRHSLLLHALSS